MSTDEVYSPPQAFSGKAHIGSHEAYLEEYGRSVADSDAFWAEQAEGFHWFEKWHTVSDYNYDMTKGPISIKWFDGGRTNIVYNCLDRHLADRADQTAIIWEGNRPDEDSTLTYRQLHEQVCKFANVLKARGVTRGDRVSIYMPMIPELAVAMLACARIGAIHSIVFGGFSADALADRISDATCTTLITCNGNHRGDKPVLLKPNADEAMAAAEKEMGKPVATCIVVEREKAEGVFAVNMKEGRDLWWHEVMADASADCPCEEMEAEDPLFILYTSGSTGKPKGVQHSVGGYMVYTAATHKYVFDYHDGDIYFCAADIGWVTGHSYIVYGPLANGATTMMFEGIPTFPNPDRYWQIIEKWKVNQ
ncbi:MAG: AMP-binding protein, partial [Candidatus Latescibacteria bacterium]|nr:AMP-binding protein [Candidatus Latescibacterota bacterium]